MRVVVDSPVWIDHLRATDKLIQILLSENRVFLTNTILGELLVGNLSRRSAILTQLLDLPRLEVPDFHLVFLLLEEQNLFGSGLNWGDVTILATCVEHRVPLYTRDVRLHRAAAKLNLAI